MSALRPKLRFSLRAMVYTVAAVAVLSAAFAWRVQTVRTQTAALRHFENSEVIITYAWQYEDILADESQLGLRVNILKNEKAESVVSLFYPPSTFPSDIDIQFAEQLPGLKYMRISSEFFTDQCVRDLRQAMPGVGVGFYHVGNDEDSLR